MSDEFLFCKNSLQDAIRAWPEKIKEKINGEPRDYLLNVNEDEYVDHIVADYTVNQLLLDREKPEVLDQLEMDVNISDYDRIITGRRDFLTFVIPYSGDKDLFYTQSSTWSPSVPSASITSERELQITIHNDGDPDRIKKELFTILDDIEKFIGWQRPDIENWNEGLQELVRSLFRVRKDKLLRDLGVVESLGFPLRKHKGVPTTYSVPVSKKIEVSRPKANSRPYKPHPLLDEDTYQEILDAMRNMALTMERSPSAFYGMKEEDLRMYFLVQLNGIFKGEATGETFNHEGKTDILIRHDGRNLFIAECKFWAGPKKFGEAIDQLLDYLTWRDSKTAIVLFVRETGISTVLSKVPDLLASHKNFLCASETGKEDEFRVRMKSRRDEALSLDLTVQIYDVPTNGE